MAQLLDQIEWGQCILEPVSDPAWEAEVRRRAGQVSEVDRRVAPLPWLRETCVALVAYRPTVLPQRLLNIGALVTAQENACRYCYGANRAYMKILGYSESFISRIERDAHMAELDPKESAFIAFCRNLARSRPRPMKADRDALVVLGYAPLAVSEMALLISLGCFYNRISILIACPPEAGFERMANGIVGRLMGLAGPLLRALAARPRAPQPVPDPATLAQGPFGRIVSTLAGLPGAMVFKNGLDGAFASSVIPRAAKALMFAVVARTLECRPSESEARKILATEGFSDAEVDTALATLDCTRLAPRDAKLLSWVRDTVYYQTAAIQRQTAALAAELGSEAILEAIGVAALANASVRLAMLLE